MILILGGTTESICFASILETNGITAIVSTASAYGQFLAETGFSGQVISGKRDLEQFIELCRAYNIEGVADMSHPYAVEVSKNGIAVAQTLGIPYFRFERPRSSQQGVDGNDPLVYFDDYKEACIWLNSKVGNILVTTGSKSVETWVGDITDVSRLHIRFLPVSEQILKMESLGLKPHQMLAMKGPFSREMNEAMLRHIDAKFLITKESGDNGMVDEKIMAAQKLGVTVLIIRRPPMDYPNKYETMDSLLEAIMVTVSKKK